MLRKVASLTALLSCFVLMVSSIVLYIVPAGRVAYWSDYHLWGLTKSQWGQLHLNMGILFFTAVFFHSCLNWKAIKTYLKNKSTLYLAPSKEFFLSILITGVFLVGTYYNAPPFSSIIHLGESISTKANTAYGEPPYGHAELSSLRTFTQKMGLDLKQSQQRLDKAGIVFSGSDQTLQDISTLNKLSPNDLYLIISPLHERAASFPQEAPPGFGKRPLIDLCQEYSVNIQSVMQFFSQYDISVHEQMTLKEIAALLDEDPFSLYEFMRQHLSRGFQSQT